jgi:hypothetical protein
LIVFTAATELQLSQFLLQKLPLPRRFIFLGWETGPFLSPPYSLQNAELPRGHGEDISVGFVSRDNID